MRNIKSIILLSLSVVLIFGCSTGSKKQSAEEKSVTSTETYQDAEPFIIDFTGVYTEVIEGTESGCEEPYQCKIQVDFTGSGTQLGNFSGVFNFCGCGPNGEYGATESYMASDNGDTLYISCEGKVLPGKLPAHPDFVNSYWKDPFIILGGTGRFEGAMGEGVTDDYNSNNDANSHHHWEGTIILANN